MSNSTINDTSRRAVAPEASRRCRGARVKECVTSLRYREGRVTVHYTLPVSARTGRRGLTLCGRGMTYDHALVERAHAMPSGVCQRCRDLKARMDRQLHDPSVPATFTAFSWVLQDMIEAQGLTVPEMAEKTGINERRLNTEVRSGNIGMTHLDDLCDVQGHGPSALPRDVADLCRDGQRHIRTIEAMRRREAVR